MQLSLLGEGISTVPVTYRAGFIPDTIADIVLENALKLPWQQNSIQTRFRPEAITLPRKEWMAGDRPGEMRYIYSGSVELVAEPWPDWFKWIKDAIELETGYSFQVVIGNRYDHGGHHIGWHNDNEPTMGERPAIASLSLGETRTFKVRPKNKSGPAVNFEASHGSLIVMHPGCQESYLHCIAKTSRQVGCRVNFTFRPWA